MGFEKFGAVNFTSETKASDFVKFLEEGKVMTTKCTRCGKVYFPPRIDCCACGASEIEWIEIDEPGELVAYSTVMYGPTGFENDVPYTIAAVRFPKGIQVFGRISKKIPTDKIKVGMKLKVVPIKLDSDRVSYQFVQP
ncbi:MAG: DNA-binding protein [Deltaproteobacteria bacterium]|nr:MAG: DNA-binding protein [Deltaproteobacteria bacterium]